MLYEEEASGLQLDAIKQSAPAEIISPTLPIPSVEESIRLELLELAILEPDTLKEEVELIRIQKEFKTNLKPLRAAYRSIKADYEQRKEAAACPVLTSEQIAQQEQDNKAAQEEQKQIEQGVKILQNECDLLPFFHQTLERAGHICTETLAGSIWLSHGSLLLPNSSAFIFTGASGSGKTDGALKGAAFLPEEKVISITSASDQALNYLGDIQGKYLIFGEIAPRIEEQDDPRQMAMRQLISENKISRLVVEKVDGKANIAVMKITEGPCVVIATSTCEPNRFDDELQNRASWVASNDSVEVTGKVLSTIADRAVNPAKRADAFLCLAIKTFQAFHLTLESLEVEIPFAHRIRPTSTHVTVRRLYNMVLNYVRANALLHQHSRERKNIDSKTIIVANTNDYKLAYRVLSSNAPRVLETCAAPARKAFDEVLKSALANNQAMSTGQIVQVLQRPAKTVSRWLRDYEKAGLIGRLDYKSGKQNNYYLVSDGPDQFTQELGLVLPEEVEQWTVWKHLL